MIDPDNITNYNMTDEELEENLIFWVLVAGKTARVVNRQLENLLANLRDIFQNSPVELRPFQLLRFYISSFGVTNLAGLMRKHGMGQFNQKAGYLNDLVHRLIDLHTCTLEELLSIKGIGLKTAKAFLMHSRPGQQHACLDVHILRWMRELGVKNVPESTPTGNQYARLEGIFLKICNLFEVTPAELDLIIWRQKSR